MLSLKNNSSEKKCKHNPEAKSEMKEKIGWEASKEFHM